MKSILGTKFQTVTLGLTWETFDKQADSLLEMRQWRFLEICLDFNLPKLTCNVCLKNKFNILHYKLRGIYLHILIHISLSPFIFYFQ